MTNPLSKSKIKPGANIVVRYYNKSERRFYGDSFQVEVIKIQNKENPEYKPYKPIIAKKISGDIITLNWNEIRMIIPS